MYDWMCICLGGGYDLRVWENTVACLHFVSVSACTTTHCN